MRLLVRRAYCQIITKRIAAALLSSAVALVDELDNYDSGALSDKNNYVDNQPGQKQSKRYQYNFKQSFQFGA